MTTDYVFLHGGKQGSWVWEETVEALSRQTEGRYGRAVTLDIPGCGTKRGRETDGMEVEQVVAELAGELDAAGVSQALLVGHSQAGTILPRLIAARPAMFRRVVYLSCSAPLPGQSISAMMGSGRHGEDPEAVGWPLDPARHPLAEQFKLMFCNDMTDVQAARFLARLGPDDWPTAVGAATDWRYDIAGSVPATYVVCLADGILPPIWQDRFAERFGASRRVKIDAGHQVMNTRPHALAEVLRAEVA